MFGGHPTINNVHCESVYTCIDVVSYAKISNVDCSPNNYINNACIVIENTGSATIDTLTSNGGYTKFVQDYLNRAGAVYSGYQLYWYTSMPGLLITSDPSIPWLYPAPIQTVPTYPALKSISGNRYVCVNTSGQLVSQATACSGT